jgi:hypothetical protein
MADKARRSVFRSIAEIGDAPILQQIADLRFGRRASPSASAPLAQTDAARTFTTTDEGSGAFGHWTLDADGLPAYYYTLNQATNGHAEYPTTDGYLRRDHWHQIGNDRITAMASNDGVVQVYLADRGGVILNRLEARAGLAEAPGFEAWAVRMLRRVLSPVFMWLARRRIERMVSDSAETGLPHGASAIKLGKEGAGHVRSVQKHARTHVAARRMATQPPAYGGGFNYLADGEKAWSTAYAWRPAWSEVHRTFGMGYAETEMTHRLVRQVRRVYAPPGDDSVLLVDVRLDNLRTRPVDLRYFEYWDVNPHQLRMQWLRTWVGQAGDDARNALNTHFLPRLIPVSEDAERVLRVHFQPPDDAPDKNKADEIDWWPADVFLADLSTAGEAEDPFTDRAQFFGRGGVGHPDAIAPTAQQASPTNSDSPPSCMVLRRRLRLEPGASATLRFAFGAAQPEQPLNFLNDFRIQPSDADRDAATHTRDYWRKSLCYFTTGPGADDNPVLQREMAWHAYNLLSATVYNAYSDAHVVPQGSAYLYLHGVDGVPRDQALFSVPLTYLRPDLARETLRLIMSVTHADTGGITYAYAGHGILSDGMIHSNPSDIDLFFLWALSEYLAATGDTDFLNCRVPFYPRDAPPPFGLGDTVLDHARAAFIHLRDEVGTGDHGLIKIGTGDWSDGVVVENAVKDGPGGVHYLNSKANGESVPNTQMALWVLPLAADVLAPHDPALAAQMRAPLARWRTAVERNWVKDKRWYLRAILRDPDDVPRPLFDESIHLESQVWALISDAAAKSGYEAELIESINTHLDDPSPIGATQIERGMVWPAISQLLTWGYTRCRPDLAWRSLHRNTFAAHAIAFPNVWFNIWTGPDGVNGKHAANAGGTWVSPVTPMCDYPAQNCNPHAMALLGLLRVCGIEPVGDGLRIAPQAPPERFTLDLPLLRLEVAPGRIAGEYRPVVPTVRVLHVKLPTGASKVVAKVGGQSVGASLNDSNELSLQLACQRDAVPFEVTYARG